jgi:hypothetical protein
VYTLLTDMGNDDLQLPHKLKRIDLRATEDDLRAWRAQAVRAKQKLSEWIRCACDAQLARAIEREREAKRR